MGIIYLLTSPSGKRYIGQSKHSIERRVSVHKSAAKMNTKKNCIVLNAAIKKYGIEKFKKEILLICENEDLNLNEIKFIDFYDTLSPNGYNLTKGGDSFHNLSEFSKQKLSISMKKRKDKSFKKKKETQDLPRFLWRYLNKGEHIGYCIREHPKCKSKTFTSKKLSLEEKFVEANLFLEKLNNEIEKESSETKCELALPEDIVQEVKNLILDNA